MATRPVVMVGTHRLVFEAEDLVAVHFGPALSEADAKAIVDALVEHFADNTYFFLADFTRIGNIPAPARRILGRSSDKLKLRAAAVYGAGFQVRILVRLIHTALALFAKRPIPQEFFDSREAAQAWLDGLRAKQPSAHP